MAGFGYEEDPMEIFASRETPPGMSGIGGMGGINPRVRFELPWQQDAMPDPRMTGGGASAEGGGGGSFGMNPYLLMGLGILSNPSQNALTGISKGALQGMSMYEEMKDRASRREQEGLRTKDAKRKIDQRTALADKLARGETPSMTDLQSMMAYDDPSSLYENMVKENQAKQELEQTERARQAGMAQIQNIAGEGPMTPEQQYGMVRASGATNRKDLDAGFKDVFTSPKAAPLQLKQVWDPATQTATYVPEEQALGRTAPPPIGFMAAPPAYGQGEAQTRRSPEEERDFLDKRLKAARSQTLPKAQIDGIEAEYKRADDKVKAQSSQVETLSKNFEASGVDGIGSALETVSRIFSQYPPGQDIPGFGQTALLPDVALSPEGVDARQAVIDLGNQIIRMRTGAAMSAQESTRIGNALGLDLSGEVAKPLAWKSDVSLRQAMPKIFNEILSKIKNRESGASPEAVKAYRERGGPVNSDRIAELMRVFDPTASQKKATPSGGPKQGEVVDGYVYVGGDPAKESSWRPQ